jgi:hypothetical protein
MENMSRRPREDIDPETEFLAVGNRRKKPRSRSKPEPPVQLKAREGAASARALRRPLSPGVLYEQEGEHFHPTAPHNDTGLWELQIFDAFGTRSRSVVMTFIEHLRRLVPEVWVEVAQVWKPDETQLNAALAMVADIQPRNVMEAALAAQMVAVHWMQMRLSAQACNRFGQTGAAHDAALAGKLARTFAMQLETLAKLRGKQKASRQTIRVRKELHQHVHYHDHRGDREIDGQPQEPRAAPITQRASLPSPQSGGEAVLRASGRRKADVPNARR